MQPQQVRVLLSSTGASQEHRSWQLSRNNSMTLTITKKLSNVSKYNKINNYKTRYVDGPLTSEVIPVTIQYIHPPHHGHTSQNHGHEWMTHSFCSMSIGHPTPETRLFQTLTLKFQGQCHECGQRARSYSRPSIY